ncbi:hypothetical protein Q6A75_04245 [Aliarcobacter skirrowii]|uniref:hypothetical protein n=1 Tax=Aliarcobacter skirrowii TaxID=28200 RepID=UPI0029BEC928|nr:hypothetical protein [Aliarcobacter skirrowii]MDX4048134.1 hypothetical protein [Aliarcobacter skirrowii]
MLFGFVFTTNAFATITGNNSISTAYDMGYWQYQNYDVTYLAPDQSEAYYKFTANAGDKVYARTSYDGYTGMSISTVTNGGIPIETKTEVINVSSYDPFIFVNIDSTSNGQVFYIKVTRGSFSGDMYFTVRVFDRIKSGSGVYDFSGTATNTGNTIGGSGKDSTIIYANLTSNPTIPSGAKVKNITTTGSQSPVQGNVWHKLQSGSTWYTSTISSSSNGSYNITLANNLDVAQNWGFRYNTKAVGASTMSNVKATIQYEYDETLGFKP